MLNSWSRLKKAQEKAYRAQFESLPLPVQSRNSAERIPFGIGWVKRFLPHYLSSPPSLLHEDLSRNLARFHERRANRYCVMAPRGAAKTTWLSKAYPLWCVCESVEPFILLLSDTSEQANSFLSSIAYELESNVLLAEHYPDSVGKGPVWQRTRLITQSGCQLLARGSGGRIRGLTANQRRPTLIIVDDPNEQNDLYSPLTRRRKLDWFSRDVISCGEPGTNILVAGTPIHNDAIVCTLARSGLWKTDRYRSIITWPDRMDLWGQWEQILCDLSSDNRLSLARQFYLDNRAEMDRGSKVLWPARESLYDLMVFRCDRGHGAFASEKQDSPATDGISEFPADYFDHDALHFDEWPADLVCKVIALDPSKGSNSKPGDYQALVKLGLSKGGYLYVDCELKREPIEEMLRYTIDQALAWGEINSLVVEDNATMGLLAPAISSIVKGRGIALPWETLTNTANKRMRVSMVGPYLARRQLRIRRSIGGRQLVQQLREFPLGEYDDGADAMATAVIRLHRFYNKNTRTLP